MLRELNNWILTATCAINLALGSYLVLKDRKSATNLSFGIFLFLLSTMSMSLVFWSISDDPAWIRFWIEIVFLSLSFLPAAFLYFAAVYPQKAYIKLRPKRASVFIPSLIFGIASFTELISKGISPPYVEPVQGQWYIIFFAYIIAYAAYSFYIVLNRYLRSSGKERLQYEYLMLGAAITAASSLFFNIFLLSKGIINFGPLMVSVLGPAFTLLTSFLVVYAISSSRILKPEVLLSGATIVIGTLFLVFGTANIIINQDSHYLIPYLAIITNVFLGFMVLFHNPRSATNRTLSALSLFCAFWIYAEFLVLTSSREPAISMWGKLVFISPAIIPSLFLFFVNVFPRRLEEISALQRGIMIGTAAIALAAVPYGMVIQIPIFLYFFAFVIYGAYSMINKYNYSVGIEKMQLRYLSAGMIAGTVLAVAANVILPMIGESCFLIYGPIFTVIPISAAAYAIGMRRLLSLEYIVERGVIYLIISLLLAALYVFSDIIAGQSPAAILQTRDLTIIFLFSCLAAASFRRIYALLRVVSDRIVFGRRYDYQNTLLDVSQRITSVIKFSELTNLIVSLFLDTIKVKEISFLLFDPDRQRFKTVPCEINTGGKYIKMEFDRESPISLWLASTGDVLVRDEIEKQVHEGGYQDLMRLHDELERLGMAVWVPVISKERLTGIISLGYKQSGDMYTDEDVGLLKILSNQLAVAIENSSMYSTIASQYDELKAAKDKLVEADKLASLGTMAAGMAHEIKNPLSSLKVFSQLLHDRYQDLEFRKKFEEIVPKEINRIDKIVEGLLSFARAPRPQRTEVSLKEILEEVLEDFGEDIKRAKIKLKKELFAVPKVLADRDQMVRAFSNIILNGIQAMPSGGTLSVLLQPADKRPKTVEVRISDTGEGITPDNQKHIFDPFFTTKHYGTGLGLAITHSILEAHGGDIKISSDPGNGTVVSVTLSVG